MTNYRSVVVSLVAAVSVVFVACSNGNGPPDGGTDSSADTSTADTGSGNDVSADTTNDNNSCSPVGSGSVTGTFFGHMLMTKDAISSLGGGTPYILITDFAGVCALGNNLKANSSGLLFDFLTASAFTVGMVNFGTDLDVSYATYDATCNSLQGESATAGSVTITSVDTCKVVGTFDVTLNADHVTGSFSAPNCIPSVTSPDGGSCM